MARLGLERRRRGGAEGAAGDQEQRARVRGRVGELDEVSGVLPAALDVDRTPMRESERALITSLSGPS